MTTAIETIKAEHRTLDRILGAMEAKLRDLTDLGPKPDLDLLFSAVYYIRIFPERYHHPKEEDHLFKSLRRRSPALYRVALSVDTTAAWIVPARNGSTVVVGDLFGFERFSPCRVRNGRGRVSRSGVEQ